MLSAAENLVDGTEKQVLGMVWAVMRTFMKFGNEEDSKINARDALLAWVKNQTLGYKHVNGKAAAARLPAAAHSFALIELTSPSHLLLCAVVI